MGGKLNIKLPNPEGVAAGGTATFRIPVGRRIHGMSLKYKQGTQTPATFTEIRLYINGQVFQRFSGTQRDKLNQFEKTAAAAGVLKIPFDRKGLITLAGREQTAINTGVADEFGRKISSMYMEVDIAAGATIAATDLELWSKESDAILTDTSGKPYGAGIIPYIRTEQRSVAGADSDFQLSDLVNPGVNAQDKVALNRVTFIPSAGVINRMKIDRNTYNVFDRPDSINRFLQADGVRVPIAGYYSIDTTENGQGGELIDLFGMTDFRYRLDVSAAATITILSEYFGTLQS